MGKKNFFYLLPLLLLLAVCVKRAVSLPFSDYAGYYSGSRELLRGHPLDAYNMLQLNLSIEAQGYKDVFVSYAPFPPFTSLVFAPFLLLPMGLSKILFNSCSCILFLFTLYRSSRFLAVPPWLLLLAPVVFFFPLVNNIFFGQSYLLLTCLLLEGFIAYRQERTVLSSLLWGVAILFKLFPGVLLFFLLLRKKYKQALYLSAACGLLFLLSLWINGVTVWKYYLSVIVPKLNNGELNDSFTYVFQSAFMLLKRVFLYDALLNPHPLVSNNPYWFAATMAVFKAVILSSAILLTIWKRNNDFFSFAVWLAASMLISPNGSSYSLVLLIIPALALAAERFSATHSDRPGSPGRSGSPIAILPALLILLVACNISVQRFGSYPVWGQFPRLYGLLLFFGLLLWQGLRGERWRKIPFAALALGLTILFFALDIRKYLPGKDPDPSSYLLTKEEHIFIYDYFVRDDKLVYDYWDGSGKHAIVTDYPVDSMDGQGLAIRDNQVWYKGRQLTVSSDRKEKPMLVNGEYIVYLSDKNRGVGFYTLRKLRL
jgi:hypothetical protein